MKPYRIVFLILAMALLPCLCSAKELNERDATRAKYLESELSHTYRGERLAIIQELASLYWDVPGEEHWYKVL
jgi:hypothetical protein